MFDDNIVHTITKMAAKNVETSNRFAKLEGFSDRSFISYIYQYILSYILSYI